MDTEATPPIALPVRRTFFDEEDDDPFMYEQLDYEHDMAVLGMTENLNNPLEPSPAPASCVRLSGDKCQPAQPSSSSAAFADSFSCLPLVSDADSLNCRELAASLKPQNLAWDPECNLSVDASFSSPERASCQVAKKRRMTGKQKPPASPGGLSVQSPAASNTDAFSSAESSSKFTKDETTSFDFLQRFD